MNKLIYKTVLFSLPLLLMLLSMELFYRVVPNNYKIKNQKIQECYDKTEVLIFGNSHTFYGLNPVFFDKPTFNLSNISQTLYFDKLLFEKHLTKFKKLKYIILSVEYTSLSQLDNSDEDIWRKYYYKSYMDLDVPIISWFDPKSFFISWTRNFNFNMRLVNRYFLEGTLVDCDNNGFGINYTEKGDLLKIKEDAPITIRKHEDNLFDFGKNVNRMQSIIDRCKNEGIKVIIVTMPVSNYYGSGVNKRKLNKIFNSGELLKISNQNVIYLNLFKDKRFTIDDFHDPDHLNYEGAKKCSNILNDLLNKIDVPSNELLSFTK